MAAIQFMAKAPIPGNSLGSAKEPCHNCFEANLICDRQRPKCFVCMQNQIECRGYKLDLSWQPGIAARGNLKDFQYPASRTSSNRGSIEAHVPKQKRDSNGAFKFITGRPAKRRKVRDGQARFTIRSSALSTDSTPTRTCLTSEMVTTPVRPVCEENSTTVNYDDLNPMQLDPSPDFIHPATAEVDEEVLSPFPLTNLTAESPSIPSSALEPYMQRSYFSESFHRFTDNDDESTTDDYQAFEPVLFPPLLFGSLHAKFGNILAQYDQDICAIPLTFDCGLNPFRVRKESSSGSQFLLHAILATSFYHLTRNTNEADNSDLMERHRTTSLHLFSKALGNPSTRSQGIAFLDTALLLMYLDSAQSANGMFNVHLEGVRSIIDMAGGADILIPKLPKLRAQLAMFIWCDVTIALISREYPILPISYLEAIIRHGRGDGWDYFSLTGCREEFIIAMIKLAKLAMQNERAQEMEWLVFDSTGVDQVEEILREWPSAPPNFSGIESEDALDEAQDRYHALEAWRTALLLYIARVFKWERTGPVPGAVRYLARVILDHARSVRRKSHVQKQLLLPVFLAAAEMQTEEYRAFARDYCKWWTKSCGFKMFTDVSSYLEDIWKEQDNPELWWATIIDRRKNDSHLPRMPQILMG